MVVRRWWLFKQRVGFYATRFVEADTPEHACALVLQQLQGEPRIALVAIEPPALEIDEVTARDGPISGAREPGLVFYPEGASRRF